MDSFDGKKYFVVSSTNAFGGKNQFLGVSYLVVGILSIIVLLIFVWKKVSLQREKDKKQK